MLRENDFPSVEMLHFGRNIIKKNNCCKSNFDKA